MGDEPARASTGDDPEGPCSKGEVAGASESPAPEAVPEEGWTTCGPCALPTGTASLDASGAAAFPGEGLARRRAAWENDGLPDGAASTGGSGGASSSASRAPAQGGAEATAAAEHLDAGASSPAEVLLRLQILDASGAERRDEVHISRSATVADLKARHFCDDIARGWRPRCVFLGRALGDTESVSSLPSGSFLQCYLQRAPALPSPQAAEENDPLLPPWSRRPSAENQAPASAERRWQDLAFHAIFAVGLAAAWSSYVSDPLVFDHFGRFFLRFFSLAWAVLSLEAIADAWQG